MPVSQVRGGSEDLNRLDSDFLVLCNIENQPPASRPRKKKENKKEKEHRGNMVQILIRIIFPIRQQQIVAKLIFFPIMWEYFEIKTTKMVEHLKRQSRIKIRIFQILTVQHKSFF